MPSPPPGGTAASTSLDPAMARDLARAWIDGWNRHDLEAILAHYAEDVEFASPRLRQVLGGERGWLRGKDALRAYFAKALAAQPELRFELTDWLVGVDTVALCYRNHRGQRVVELLQLNAAGRVARAMVQYAAPDSK